ncbi:uncharacterized protein BJ171DRAFT_493975 [Polychytrium aggregatum]|uniref:uncharacterized protein n=1 Tax=Polychytrium aggregatum TaxID=110093 RepID=UPI0022FE18CC|nr:uncharacterized protein BJ171DRAFT_493975 [Polychytrium aggregatum]KAI9207239.1 hypothetical protein BJ171DRAFT_493975 [Polychytrium aggregatum]
MYSPGGDSLFADEASPPTLDQDSADDVDSSSSPLRWKWGFGMRAGDLVWTPLVHPIYHDSVVLWPARVIRRLYETDVLHPSISWLVHNPEGAMLSASLAELAHPDFVLHPDRKIEIILDEIQRRKVRLTTNGSYSPSSADPLSLANNPESDAAQYSPYVEDGSVLVSDDGVDGIGRDNNRNSNDGNDDGNNSDNSQDGTGKRSPSQPPNSKRVKYDDNNDSNDNGGNNAASQFDPAQIYNSDTNRASSAPESYETVSHWLPDHAALDSPSSGVPVSNSDEHDGFLFITSNRSIPNSNSGLTLEPPMTINSIEMLDYDEDDDEDADYQPQDQGSPVSSSSGSDSSSESNSDSGSDAESDALRAAPLLPEEQKSRRLANPDESVLNAAGDSDGDTQTEHPALRVSPSVEHPTIWETDSEDVDFEPKDEDDSSSTSGSSGDSFASDSSYGPTVPQVPLSPDGSRASTTPNELALSESSSPTELLDDELELDESEFGPDFPQSMENLLEMFRKYDLEGQAQFIVEPLPFPTRLEPLRKKVAGSWRPETDEESAVRPRNFWLKAETSLIPFMMHLPTMKDMDVYWNRAVIQALDLSSSWAIPSAEEDVDLHQHLCRAVLEPDPGLGAKDILFGYLDSYSPLDRPIGSAVGSAVVPLAAFRLGPERICPGDLCRLNPRLIGSRLTRSDMAIIKQQEGHNAAFLKQVFPSDGAWWERMECFEVHSITAYIPPEPPQDAEYRQHISPQVEMRGRILIATRRVDVKGKSKYRPHRNPNEFDDERIEFSYTGEERIIDPTKDLWGRIYVEFLRSPRRCRAPFEGTFEGDGNIAVNDRKPIVINFS